MDETGNDRVLIAGGGIAGLAMRRALQRRGIPSLTLERRLEAADAGLAITMATWYRVRPWDRVP